MRKCVLGNEEPLDVVAEWQNAQTSLQANVTWTYSTLFKSHSRRGRGRVSVRWKVPVDGTHEREGKQVPSSALDRSGTYDTYDGCVRIHFEWLLSTESAVTSDTFSGDPLFTIALVHIVGFSVYLSIFLLTLGFSKYVPQLPTLAGCHPHSPPISISCAISSAFLSL